VAHYSVIYDACVLYPAPLRDLLIQLATGNLFRAKWTDAIHEEWIVSVLRDRSDLTRAQLSRTRSLMNMAVRDCLVTGYENLIDAIELPDPGDRHVVAAAIHAKADAIVTYNIKDFPKEALARHNLEAIHPDEFINHQIGLDESAIVVAATVCCTRLKRPPMTGPAYLDLLERLSLTMTVAALRPYQSILGTPPG
jgi:predicted nucleic acid-binding protein